MPHDFQLFEQAGPFTLVIEEALLDFSVAGDKIGYSLSRGIGIPFAVAERTDPALMLKSLQTGPQLGRDFLKREI